MTLYQKLFLAALYVLNFDIPVDYHFEVDGVDVVVYNYVEKNAIGVDFVVDNYEDLWWEIRRGCDVDYDRLNKAIKTVLKNI